MGRLLMLVALGWLVFGGVMHFSIDVLSQHLRGKRSPSAETTAYYGLHSAYSLSQLLLAAVGLLIAFSAPTLLLSVSFKILCCVVTCLWLCICVLFVEYWQPRLIAGIFGALVLASSIF